MFPPTNSVLFALTLPLLVVITNSAVLSGPDEAACRAAYHKCHFYFGGSTRLMTYTLTEKSDFVFSRRIASKKRGEYIGVVNTNGNAVDVLRGGRFAPISRFGGKNPLPAHALKPYNIRRSSGSGIGKQNLKKSQVMALNKKCIRMYFSNYQVLRWGGQVKSVHSVPRSDEICIVFRTIARLETPRNSFLDTFDIFI